MFRRFCHDRWFVRLRRAARPRSLVVYCCLVLYLLASSGVPLPLAPKKERGEERYPCESGHCGCRTARQCWLSCCCNTHLQRLEWARQNGVRPPSYALKAAETEHRLLAARGSSTSDSSADTKSTALRTQRSCCQPKVAAGTSPCDSGNASLCKSSEAPRAGKVVALEAFRCQGLSPDLMFLGLIALQPDVEMNLTGPCPAVWIAPHGSDRPITCVRQPLVPPPEAPCV
jgi:hypothetical protein